MLETWCNCTGLPIALTTIPAVNTFFDIGGWRLGDAVILDVDEWSHVKRGGNAEEIVKANSCWPG